MVAAASTLIGFIIVLKAKADLAGSAFVWLTIFAGSPLVVAFANIVVPKWLKRRRVDRVVGKSEQATPNDFRIGPREDMPEDRERYDRADKRHVDVLNWLRGADEPILFLTGRSGTGKSSLLAAYVLPELRDSAPAVRSLIVRSYDDPVAALAGSCFMRGFSTLPHPDPDQRSRSGLC